MVTLPSLTDVAAVHPAGNTSAARQTDADGADFNAVLQDKVTHAMQSQPSAAHAGENVGRDAGQGAGRRPPSVKADATQDSQTGRDTATSAEDLTQEAISGGHGKKNPGKAPASDVPTTQPPSLPPAAEPAAVPLVASGAGETVLPTATDTGSGDDGLPNLLTQSRSLLATAGVSGLPQAATLAADRAMEIPATGAKSAPTHAERLNAALPGGTDNTGSAPATDALDTETQRLAAAVDAKHDSRNGNLDPRPLTAASESAAAAPASTPSATDAAALFPAALSGATAATAATATPPSAMIASQLGSDEWQQAIGQQLMMFARNNQSNAELRLHPADLGTLQISLHMQDNQLQIHMVSDHAQVRDTLQAALPHLRTALAESGIQLGQSSVGGQAYSGGQNGDGNAAGGRQTRGFTPVNDSAPQGQPFQSATAVSHGRINTYI